MSAHPQPINPPATPTVASIPATRGRRAGARGRVSHRAALAMLFEHHWDEAPELLRRSCTPAYFAVLTRMLDRELEVAAPAIDDFSDAELDHTVRLARPPRTASTVFNGETGPEPRQRRSGALRTALTVFNGETGPEPRQRRSGALRAPHLRCLTVRRGLRRRRTPLEPPTGSRRTPPTPTPIDIAVDGRRSAGAP